MQDFGLLSKEIDVRTVISVANGRQYKVVNIHMAEDSEGMTVDKGNVDSVEDTDVAGHIPPTVLTEGEDDDDGYPV